MAATLAAQIAFRADSSRLGQFRPPRPEKLRHWCPPPLDFVHDSSFPYSIPAKWYSATPTTWLKTRSLLSQPGPCQCQLLTPIAPFRNPHDPTDEPPIVSFHLLVAAMRRSLPAFIRSARAAGSPDQLSPTSGSPPTARRLSCSGPPRGPRTRARTTHGSVVLDTYGFGPAAVDNAVLAKLISPALRAKSPTPAKT